MSQKIRIKLKSYDYNLVDKSAEKIVKTVKSTGAVVTGPIPLPTNKKIFTVLRSPHVNKKSREQFQLSSYKRLLDIYSSSSKTIDALMKLELPSGVEVEIKVWYLLRLRLANIEAKCLVIERSRNEHVLSCERRKNGKKYIQGRTYFLTLNFLE